MLWLQLFPIISILAFLEKNGLKQSPLLMQTEFRIRSHFNLMKIASVFLLCKRTSKVYIEMYSTMTTNTVSFITFKILNWFYQEAKYQTEGRKGLQSE